METSLVRRALSLYILPVPLDSTPGAVAGALLTRLATENAQDRLEPFAIGVANAFAIPGDGMPVFGFSDPVER